MTVIFITAQGMLAKQGPQCRTDEVDGGLVLSFQWCKNTYEIILDRR